MFRISVFIYFITSSKIVLILLLFSCSVVSNSLWPHGLQHTRLLSSTVSEFAQTCAHWVNDAIQSSHPLLPPSPPSLKLSQHQGFFQWVGSSHQVAKILELKHQSFWWIFKTDFLYDWLVWSPCSPRDSQESSPAPQFESINSSALSLLYDPTLTSVYDYWKNYRFDYGFWLLSQFFNMLSSFVIAFLPRSKRLLISWLQSPSATILEPEKIKSVTVSPSIPFEVMGPDAMVLVFWMLSFKPAFSLSSFIFVKKLFSFSSLSVIRVVSSVYLRLLIFLPAIFIPACDLLYMLKIYVTCLNIYIHLFKIYIKSFILYG